MKPHIVIPPLPRILELLLEGKTQEGIQALSYYVARMKEGRAKGGRVESKAKSEAAKKRWEKRWSCASARLREEAVGAGVDLDAVTPEVLREARKPENMEREIREIVQAEVQAAGEEYRIRAEIAKIRRGEHSKEPLPYLSIPGVKLGSDLEARG